MKKQESILNHFHILIRRSIISIIALFLLLPLSNNQASENQITVNDVEYITIDNKNTITDILMNIHIHYSGEKTKFKINGYYEKDGERYFTDSICPITQEHETENAFCFKIGNTRSSRQQLAAFIDSLDFRGLKRLDAICSVLSEQYPLLLSMLPDDKRHTQVFELKKQKYQKAANRCLTQLGEHLRTEMPLSLATFSASESENELSDEQTDLIDEKLALFKEKNEKLQSEIDQLKIRIKELKKALQTSVANNRDGENQAENLTLLETANEKLKQSESNLTLALTGTKRELADLQNKLRASEKTKVDIEQRYDELLNELASAKDALKELSTSLQNLTGENSDLQNKLTALKNNSAARQKTEPENNFDCLPFDQPEFWTNPDKTIIACSLLSEDSDAEVDGKNIIAHAIRFRIKPELFLTLLNITDVDLTSRSSNPRPLTNVIKGILKLEYPVEVLEKIVEIIKRQPGYGIGRFDPSQIIRDIAHSTTEMEDPLSSEYLALAENIWLEHLSTLQPAEQIKWELDNVFNSWNDPSDIFSWKVAMLRHTSFNDDMMPDYAGHQLLADAVFASWLGYSHYRHFKSMENRITYENIYDNLLLIFSKTDRNKLRNVRIGILQGTYSNVAMNFYSQLEQGRVQYDENLALIQISRMIELEKLHVFRDLKTLKYGQGSDIEGGSYLHYLARTELPESIKLAIAKQLIELSFDPNQQTISGRTALDYAIKTPNQEKFLEFLANRTSVEIAQNFARDLASSTYAGSSLEKSWVARLKKAQLNNSASSEITQDAVAFSLSNTNGTTSAAFIEECTSVGKRWSTRAKKMCACLGNTRLGQIATAGNASALLEFLTPIDTWQDPDSVQIKKLVASGVSFEDLSTSSINFLRCKENLIKTVRQKSEVQTFFQSNETVLLEMLEQAVVRPGGGLYVNDQRYFGQFQAAARAFYYYKWQTRDFETFQDIYATTPKIRMFLKKSCDNFLTLLGLEIDVIAYMGNELDTKPLEKSDGLSITTWLSWKNRFTRNVLRMVLDKGAAESIRVYKELNKEKFRKNFMKKCLKSPNTTKIY